MSGAHTWRSAVQCIHWSYATAVTMSVKASFQTVRPFRTDERRPAVSKCCRTWAALASAVGETKLPLAAMVAVLRRRGEGRVAPGRGRTRRIGRESPEKREVEGVKKFPLASAQARAAEGL